MRTTNQRKCLLDSCDDWDVSADLRKWDNHPSIIKETRLRPDIMTHSAYTITDYGGASNSIQKQNQQKRDIFEPGLRVGKCLLQSCGDAC